MLQPQSLRRLSILSVSCFHSFGVLSQMASSLHSDVAWESYPSIDVRTPAIRWQKQWPLYNIIYHPGPLFSILSHTGVSSQCEGGILFDRPVQMLNDSDTKRRPTTQVLTGLFSIEKRLDLTQSPTRHQITAQLLTPLWPAFNVYNSALSLCDKWKQ